MQSAIDDGKISWEEWGDIAQNVISRISDKLLDDLLDSIFQVNKASGSGGGSLFGSLLGGIFGGSNSFPAAPKAPVGLFAKGGISDRPAIFGEGPLPEAAVPLPDGRRIPVDLRTSSAPAAETAGKSVVELRLSSDLQARILEQAGNQTVTIVRQNEEARRNRYQNGGETY
ncbi:hypothetical protein ABK249_11900 [Neorhizobium sp. Rsf11]|uniref:Tail tape measure protein n=1 Tax=Neorhizobium phenanthreniclasticum TaxID=3157917 RepID=A0ABV0M198_9HYPH